jgi:hypothetical protein
MIVGKGVQHICQVADISGDSSLEEDDCLRARVTLMEEVAQERVV